MQLDMSAPCSDWGEIATKSFFTEGNFQITEHWWGKSCPNSSLSIHCWALLSAGWWHTQQVMPSLFCSCGGPSLALLRGWNHGHSLVTFPSSSDTAHPSWSPHLSSSFWNISFLYFGFPLHWLDLLLMNVLSLAAAFTKAFTARCPSDNVLLLPCLRGVNGTRKRHNLKGNRLVSHANSWITHMI